MSSTYTCNESGTANGLPVIDAGQIAVMTAVDALVSRWAATLGAAEIGLPAMLDVQELQKIDYFVNFPQLANVVTTLSDEIPTEISAGAIPNTQLRPATLVLPSAACYGAYFAHSGAILDQPLQLTTRALCSRAETRYESLRRLRTFQMREVIHIGTRDGAEQFVEHSKIWVSRVVALLGIDARLLPASDPFFNANGSRAVMQRLSRVKEELVYQGDLAVSSVNFHRNFFGERCDIRDAQGKFVFSACFGVGLERWAYMLLDSCCGNTGKTLERIKWIGDQVVD